MPESPRSIRQPTTDEIVEKAKTHYMDLSKDEIETLSAVIEDKLGVFERIDRLAPPDTEQRIQGRSHGYRPSNEEDPLNAFVRKCNVSRGVDGPLEGITVGLKDNITVGGIKMTCGSDVLSDYLPSTDAKIVTRLLDAGAEIAGKTNMGELAVSGSHSTTGPVLNPRDPDHLAGGSSGGSAVAVVTGDVDIAVGTDQGGSIRIPASWSGCVGLKPTHGLVPYTGIASLEPTLDHVGPMSTTVENCAKTLDVIAGPDPLDPRQSRIPNESRFEEAIGGPNKDFTVGVLTEGFGFDESEDGVDSLVTRSLETFGENPGIEIEEVSVPYHLEGVAIWNGVFIEGLTALIRENGLGRFLEGYYDVEFGESFGLARQTNADDFPETLKFILVLGQYLSDEFMGRYYGKAQNIRGELRQAYNDALADFDVLAMPTTPRTAPKHDPSLGPMDKLESIRSSEKIRNANTAPFNVTGHPAISVPAGTLGKLPVGLMFVGDRLEDDTVLSIAKQFMDSKT